MGFNGFLKLLAQFFKIVSWPSLCLLCPIYTSIRVIESDEKIGYQQCLRYWVLFSIVAIFEYTFHRILAWLPLWPIVKGIAAILLTIPSFAGASYVYSRYVRPDIAEVDSSLNEVPNFYGLDNSSGDFTGAESPRSVIHFRAKDCLQIPSGNPGKEGSYSKDNQEFESHKIKDEYKAANHTCGTHLSNQGKIKQVQREWSCPLCLITTNSENSLRMHLKGKKHKMIQVELKSSKGSSQVIERLNRITWINYEKLSVLISPVINPTRWCIWEKPAFGCIKLNTDGSIDGDNSSFGGLFRDSNANPICAYHTRVPGDDIFLAELWAIWRGLVLASSLEIKTIWVESDSQSVVKTINKEQHYPQKASGCLKQIWLLLKKFDKQHVSFAWRESNRAADHLSRMGVLGNDSVIWPGDFPAELLKIVQEDGQGKPYYRR